MSLAVFNDILRVFTLKLRRACALSQPLSKQDLTRFFMKKLCLLILFSMLSASVAAQTFRIDDIRVDGLQRISEGNVFSFIPVEVGDTLTPSLGRATIRDLFRTGFFDDISLAREGNVLVIEVTERPAISSICNRRKPPD